MLVFFYFLLFWSSRRFMFSQWIDRNFIHIFISADCFPKIMKILTKFETDPRSLCKFFFWFEYLSAFDASSYSHIINCPVIMITAVTGNWWPGVAMDTIYLYNVWLGDTDTAGVKYTIGGHHAKRWPLLIDVIGNTFPHCWSFTIYANDCVIPHTATRLANTSYGHSARTGYYFQCICELHYNRMTIVHW